MCVLDAAALESLCSGSSGDIRSALNSLQFISFPGVLSHQTRSRSCIVLFKCLTILLYMSTDKALWTRKDRHFPSGIKQMKKTRSKKTKQLDGEPAIGGKDASLFLFRALGKILHCKRELFLCKQSLPPFWFLTEFLCETLTSLLQYW